MTSSPRNPADGSGPDRPDRGWLARAAHVDPADPDLLAQLGLVIPDDARALDADRRALLGEPVGRAKQFAAHATPPYSYSARAAITLLVVLLTVSAALAGSLATMLTPRTETAAPGTVALAPDPAATPGVIGGLLPSTGVRLDGLGTSARTVRPAVLFVPPDGPCASCATVLESLWRQSDEFGIDVYAVVALDQAAATEALVTRATQHHGHVLVDPAGALRAAYSGSTSRAVFVHADGVVGAIVDDPAAKGRYEQVLSPLRAAGAPPSLRPATPAR